MNRIQYENNWPESWKLSYYYDCQELWGEIDNYTYYYCYKNRRDAALKYLTSAIPNNGRIIDIAAGQGNFSLSLAEMGYNVTWNDLRTELSEYVRKKYEHGKISYAEGDAFELVFKEKFDSVLATEIIEHVAHPDEFMASCSKLLKLGGCIVMTTPNGAFFKNNLPRFSECKDSSIFESMQFKPDGDGHIFLLYPDEIRELAAKIGCKVEKMAFLNFPLAAGLFNHIIPAKYLPGFFINISELLLGCLPQIIASKLAMHVVFRLRLQ